MNDGIVQICPGSCGGKQFQFQIQRLFEVIADILYDFLLGRRRKTGYRNRSFASFFLLILADEFTDVKIIYPEILPPRRKTMGFVDDKPYDMARHQNSLDGFGTEHFRSYV